MNLVTSSGVHADSVKVPPESVGTVKGYEKGIEEEVVADVNLVTASWPMTDRKLGVVKEATQCDDEMSVVIQYTKEGWPKYMNFCVKEAQAYCSVRGHLSEFDGLLVVVVVISFIYPAVIHILIECVIYTTALCYMSNNNKSSNN